MKTIIAEKCKDGWLVKIIDTRIIGCESDVYQLIRQEGCKVKNKQRKIKSEEVETDEVIKIFGE